MWASLLKTAPFAASSLLLATSALLGAAASAALPLAVSALVVAVIRALPLAVVALRLALELIPVFAFLLVAVELLVAGSVLCEGVWGFRVLGKERREVGAGGEGKREYPAIENLRQEEFQIAAGKGQLEKDGVATSSLSTTDSSSLSLSSSLSSSSSSSSPLGT